MLANFGGRKLKLLKISELNFFSARKHEAASCTIIQRKAPGLEKQQLVFASAAFSFPMDSMSGAIVR